MRAALALAIVLVAAPALAREATSDLALTTKDIAFVVNDLDFTVTDLDMRVEDMIRVKEEAKEITIELPADILFDFDKADIRAEAAVALAAATEIIRASAKGTVRIDGHTDSKGAPAYNQTLSTNRARSVMTWLVEKGGLAKVQFKLKGFGATKPVAPNAKQDGSDDPVGRQLNRRVEITFAKK
jgi:outer membrane protein OmpA-like peptidoglycan-associated protein